MLPPLDENVLKENPDFALLYGKLTNVVLNPDASTRQPPAEAKRREAIRNDLNNHRLKAAKQHLLTRALSTASPDTKAKPSDRQPPLSQDHLDLLLLLPPLLDAANPVSPAHLSLLLSSPPLSRLPALLPSLTPLVSSAIHTFALGLTRVARPSTNPSYLHRHVASLPAHVSALLARHEALHASLAASRLAALSALLALLASHTRLLTALIRTLEVKHGIVARNMELRAADAAREAHRTERAAAGRLREIRAEVYTPEAVEALVNYGRHLRDAKSRMEERIRGLRAELDAYGVGVPGGEEKERKMREMARMHREMTRQMQDTRGDLARLERG